MDWQHRAQLDEQHRRAAASEAVDYCEVGRGAEADAMDEHKWLGGARAVGKRRGGAVPVG